jgi:hypothetical protein
LLELGSEFIKVLWSSGNESDSVARFGEETTVEYSYYQCMAEEERDMYIRGCSSGACTGGSETTCLYPLKILTGTIADTSDHEQRAN